MQAKDRVFFHKKDRKKNFYDEGTVEHEVAEIAYECFLELTGVAYSAINRAYPKAEREKNPKLEYRWSDAHRTAKEFLTRYKNLVKDVVIPLAKITKYKEPYDDSQDQHTREFKMLIIENNFMNLWDKLKTFGPLILPPEDVESYEKVLDMTYEKVRKQLYTTLSYFEAEGRLKESDFLDGTEKLGETKNG